MCAGCALFVQETLQAIISINIIGIEDSNKIASRQGQATIKGVVSVLVLLINIVKALILIAANDFSSLVGGTIINDDQLKISMGLPQHTFHRRANKALVVVGRYNNGNFTISHNILSQQTGLKQKYMVSTTVFCSRQYLHAGIRFIG